ncbi:hypothetical protein [uncultured Lentibacter sp.]|jgi:hypothetical protein|uniref:hypothetical protein n=1 Tax=uncultured Lentibacter sp. TaxID=1659309 RepID=UPI00262437C4|nr:hypothetical protein [uncultured Lentibacter sp.]
MLNIKLAAMLSGALLITGCSEAMLVGLGAEGGQGRVNTDKTFDYGQGSEEEEHLSNLVAGIWVDPNGCDHWIIDDGIEGYLSQRLDPYGKPVCSGIAPPNTAIGPYKGDQTITDPL